MSPCFNHYDQICQKISRNFERFFQSDFKELKTELRNFLLAVKEIADSFEWY